MIRSVKKRLSGVRTRARGLAPQRRLLGLVGLCGDGMKCGHINRKNENLEQRRGMRRNNFDVKPYCPNCKARACQELDTATLSIPSHCIGGAYSNAQHLLTEPGIEPSKDNQ